MTVHHQDDHADGQLATNDQLLRVLESFPTNYMDYAFGYGSGVFSQNLGRDLTSPGGMLDMIFVVNDTTHFHEANLERNPQHYAPWIRWGGSSRASSLQRNFPLADAKVLFHVVDDPLPMKYGVVDRQDLVDDLTDWKYLYLAGRLHKPTLPVLPVPSALRQPMLQNLQAAVAATLLITSYQTAGILPWVDFYARLAALSYTGDFRMQMGGEDPQKILKLVQAPGQLDRFQSLYHGTVLRPLEQRGALHLSTTGVEWDPQNRESMDSQISLLPKRLHKASPAADADAVQSTLSANLQSIVAPAARNQSFKGIFTFGLKKSLKYASAKLAKGLLRRR